MPVFEEQVKMLSLAPMTVTESDSMIIFRNIAPGPNHIFVLTKPTLINRLGLFGTFEHVDVDVIDVQDGVHNVLRERYRTSYIDSARLDNILATMVKVRLQGESSLRELSLYKAEIRRVLGGRFA